MSRCARADRGCARGRSGGRGWSSRGIAASVASETSIAPLVCRDPGTVVTRCHGEAIGVVTSCMLKWWTVSLQNYNAKRISFEEYFFRFGIEAKPDLVP